MGASFVRITRSQITGNTATIEGGGIWADAGRLEVFDSTISGNTANRFGGGVLLQDTDSLLSNVTVSGNSVTGRRAATEL